MRASQVSVHRNGVDPLLFLCVRVRKGTPFLELNGAQGWTKSPGGHSPEHQTAALPAYTTSLWISAASPAGRPQTARRDAAKGQAAQSDCSALGGPRSAPAPARGFSEEATVYISLFSTIYGAPVAGLCTTKHNNAQPIPAKIRILKSLYSLTQTGC